MTPFLDDPFGTRRIEGGSRRERDQIHPPVERAKAVRKQGNPLGERLGAN